MDAPLRQSRKPTLREINDQAYQTLRRLLALTSDPLLNGYTGQDDKPRQANPITSPPPRVDQWGRRRYAPVGEYALDDHIRGIDAAALYATNSTTRRAIAWGENTGIIAALADHISHPYPPQDDTIAAVLAATSAERGGITPARARRALQADPAKAPNTVAKQRAEVDEQHHPILEALHNLSYDANPGDYKRVHRAIRTSTDPTTRPNQYALITWDVDGDGTKAGRHEAEQIAAEIVMDCLVHLPVPPIIEPSRHRTGSYVRVLVQLGDIAPERFNASLDQMQQQLVDRYRYEHAHLCSVRGRLTGWANNPAYDPAANTADDGGVWTERAAYEWRRDHAGSTQRDGTPVVWTYNPSLEPLVLHGPRELTTAPMHDIAGDPDKGKARVQAWGEIIDRRREVPTATELFERLGCLAAPGIDERHHDTSPQTPTVGSTCHIDTPTRRRAARTSPRPVRVAANRLQQAADTDLPALRPGIDTIRLTGSDPWLAKVAAARIAARFTKDDEQAAIMATRLYETHGPASGMTQRDRERRLHDSARCVAFARQTFDHNLARPGRTTENPQFAYDPEQGEAILPRLRQLVPSYLIRLHNDCRRAGLTMEVLAHALAAIQQAMHDDYGERGAASTKHILSALLQAGVAHRHETAAAVVELLKDTSLLRQTREAAPGQCRMYEVTQETPIIPMLANRTLVRRCQSIPPCIEDKSSSHQSSFDELLDRYKVTGDGAKGGREGAMRTYRPPFPVFTETASDHRRL